MKKTRNFLMFVIIIMILAACAASTPEPEEHEPEFHAHDETFQPTLQDFARVDGSTVTIPFSEAIVAHFHGEGNEDVIDHNQTSNAIENVVTGQRDIAFVTHPSYDEVRLAQERGIELEMIPIINDAFVFIVNHQTPVNGLTTQQIQQIYSGSITNWHSVGGPDLDIVPLQRPEGSGSQSGMQRFMGDVPLMEPPFNAVYMDMGGLVERVGAGTVYDTTEAAIGFSYFYWANNMFVRDGIKMLAVDGVEPNNQTIQSGEYPIVVSYYAVIRADEPEDSFARMLLAFVLSNTGQDIVENTGYVRVR